MPSGPIEVQAFLDEAKQLVEAGRFDLVLRKETREAMTFLGYMSKSEVACVISQLTVNDYVEGPVPDDDPNRSGEVWVFGPLVEGTQFYVKVKIRKLPEVVCLSFHPPIKPLDCPYR